MQIRLYWLIYDSVWLVIGRKSVKVTVIDTDHSHGKAQCIYRCGVLETEKVWEQISFYFYILNWQLL